MLIIIINQFLILITLQIPLFLIQLITYIYYFIEQKSAIKPKKLHKKEI